MRCITSVDGTVEPPCGTTSRKEPPPTRDRLSKTHARNVPSQSLPVGTVDYDSMTFVLS